MTRPLLSSTKWSPTGWAWCGLCVIKITPTPRSADCDRLPLTSRQRPHRLVRVADVDSHLGDLFARGLLREGDVEAAQQPANLCGLLTEEEVPPDRHQRHDREVLVDG